MGGGNNGDRLVTVTSLPPLPSCLAYGGKRRSDSPTCETGVGVGWNEGSEPSWCSRRTDGGLRRSTN